MTAYVVNNADSTVTPIRLATGTPGTPIKVAQAPTAIAITPDGKTAYVTSVLSDVTKGLFIPRRGEVTPIRLATGTPGTPVTVGSNPTAIAITPDGATAYVADFADGAVTPVGLAAGTPRTPIKVPLGPHSIAITPDGKAAYVASLLVAPSLRRLQTAPPGMVTPICLPSSK